jgi:hypothetical protein
MTMKQDCENKILEYAPIVRQLNAAMEHEHREYIAAVLAIFRGHYHKLKAQGATEWTDPDTTWIDENKPY